MLNLPINPKNDKQRDLLKKFEQQLKISDDDRRKQYSTEQQQQWVAHAVELKQIEQTKPALPPSTLGAEGQARDTRDCVLLAARRAGSQKRNG